MIINNEFDFVTICYGALEENDIQVNILRTSDEANFHRQGFMSKQNFKYCSEISNPHLLHETPLRSRKVTV